MPPVKPVSNKSTTPTHSTPSTSSTPSGSSPASTKSQPQFQHSLGTDNTRNVTHNIYGKPSKKYVTNTGSSPRTGSSPNTGSSSKLPPHDVAQHPIPKSPRPSGSGPNTI